MTWDPTLPWSLARLRYQRRSLRTTKSCAKRLGSFTDQKPGTVTPTTGLWVQRHHKSLAVRQPRLWVQRHHKSLAVRRQSGAEESKPTSAKPTLATLIRLTLARLTLAKPFKPSYTPEPHIAFCPFLSTPFESYALNSILFFYLIFVQLQFLSCFEHFFGKVSESNPMSHFGSFCPAKPKIKPNNQPVEPHTET